jgi:hypothetical protein
LPQENSGFKKMHIIEEMVKLTGEFKAAPWAKTRFCLVERA